MNFDLLFDEQFGGNILNEDIEALQEYLINKKGWIYIATTKDHHLYKIGRTGKTPLERAKSLSTTGVLNSYEITFSLPFFNQYIAEKNIFKTLKKFRSQKGKEFFQVNKDVAIKAIEAEYKKQEKLLNRFLKTSILEEDINLVDFAIKQLPQKS
jgi:dihydroorotase